MRGHFVLLQRLEPINQWRKRIPEWNPQPRRCKTSKLASNFKVIDTDVFVPFFTIYFVCWFETPSVRMSLNFSEAISQFTQSSDISFPLYRMLFPHLIAKCRPDTPFSITLFKGYNHCDRCSSFHHHLLYLPDMQPTTVTLKKCGPEPIGQAGGKGRNCIWHKKWCHWRHLLC